MGKFLSVVIPVYNEEDNVIPLFKEVDANASKLVRQKKISGFEVIYISDGSKDKTNKNLELLKKQFKSKVKIILFRRRFGKAEAYKAGFSACKGDLIFTMDGDLQDNPNDMRSFVDKIEQGYDLVVGWKYFRKDPITKRLPSKLFNAILRSFTGLKLHDMDCGYRLMTREVLKHLDFYEGLYRYIPVFASSKGFKITEVKVHHRKRKYGKSKYGFSRLFKGFFDLITVRFLFSYQKRPLHFFGGLGALFFTIGFLIGLYLTYVKLVLGELIGNRPLLTLGVFLMIIGVQLVIFGLLGEMIAYIFKKEKNYVIKKSL
jgi:glycosyltransferase involved in cell wall biosynthesis